MTFHLEIAGPYLTKLEISLISSILMLLFELLSIRRSAPWQPSSSENEMASLNSDFETAPTKR